jgi:hypothetical protein
MENILGRVSVALAAAALCGLAAVACGGGGDVEEAAPPVTPAAPAAPAPAAPAPRAHTTPRSAAIPLDRETPKGTCKDGAHQMLGSERVAYAALVRTRAGAFRAPGRGALASFERLNANRVPTVFGVVSAVVGRNCRPSWYRVRLPIRPNGIVGYVRASDVRVEPVRTRISVDLSARTVTLYRNGREVLSTSAPNGPFGPGAIGISAFSPVLTGWTQGGPIAIHGTNRPELLGQRVSNGCIRVHNRDLRRLFAAALSGTPVTIHP